MHSNLLLAELYRTNTSLSVAVKDLLLISFGIVIMALLSQVAFPLPFTPVPMTGQTFGVLSLGLLYGRRLGVMTIIGYIILGAFGLPIFAKWGSGLPLFSPSGGYLIGYIFAVLLCGALAEKGWTHSYVKMGILMLLAESLIYLFGLFQLQFFIQSSVWAAGLYPFIIADLIKMGLVTLMFPSIWKIKTRLFS